jgi:hypothetical protein
MQRLLLGAVTHVTKPHRLMKQVTCRVMPTVYRQTFTVQHRRPTGQTKLSY